MNKFILWFTTNKYVGWAMNIFLLWMIFSNVYLETGWYTALVFTLMVVAGSHTLKTAVEARNKIDKLIVVYNKHHKKKIDNGSN